MWGLGPAVLFGAAPALGPNPSPHTRRPSEAKGPTPAPARHEEAEQEVALGSPWALLAAAGPHSSGCRGSACGAPQGAGLTPRAVGRCAGQAWEEWGSGRGAVEGRRKGGRRRAGSGGKKGGARKKPRDVGTLPRRHRSCACARGRTDSDSITSPFTAECYSFSLILVCVAPARPALLRPPEQTPSSVHIDVAGPAPYPPPPLRLVLERPPGSSAGCPVRPRPPRGHSPGLRRRERCPLLPLAPSQPGRGAAGEP
ncbi:unnamed protein product [Eretmochelys imbricata]